MISRLQWLARGLVLAGVVSALSAPSAAQQKPQPPTPAPLVDPAAPAASDSAPPALTDSEKLKIREVQRAIDQIELQGTALQQKLDDLRRAFQQNSEALQKLAAAACNPDGTANAKKFALDENTLHCAPAKQEPPKAAN